MNISKLFITWFHKRKSGKIGDVPFDYKKELDREVLNLMSAAKKIWKLTRELPNPTDKFVAGSGNGVTVIIKNINKGGNYV